MTGLDTNVIIRFLVQDDVEQAAAAAKLFDTFTAEAPAFVSLVAVTELVWVLESSYGAARHEIAAVLEDLLRTRELVIERADLVWQALRCFRNGNADFADCVIDRCGQAAGCDHTMTFDLKAANTAGMTLLC